MRLKQQVFELRTLGGKEIPSNTVRDLKLVVNGVRTDTPLTELFVDYNLQDSNIKGWSLLQFINKEGNLKVNEELVSVKLYSDKSEEEIVVTKVRDPFPVQYPEKELDSAAIDDYVAKLNSPSTGDLEEEPEAKSESQPRSEEAAPSSEEEAEDSLVKLNDNYNREKAHLIKDGYREYTDKNYSFLYKEGEDPSLMRIDTEEKFTTIPIVELEKNGEQVMYKMIEGEKTRFLLYKVDESIELLTN